MEYRHYNRQPPLDQSSLDRASRTRAAIRRRRPVDKGTKSQYLEELALEDGGRYSHSGESLLEEPHSPGGSLPGVRDLERQSVVMRPQLRDIDWQQGAESKRKLRAKVAFSYAPANDDELRLDVGETVEIVKQEEEGWWEGTLNGKTGMFPSNFVELVGDEQPEPEEKGQPQANDKDKKKVIGVGLGNIFKDGPINLRPTGELNKAPVEPIEPKPMPHSAPAVRSEDKSGSLKKNAFQKQPPALPPKDVTETKKVSPATEIDDKFPLQSDQRSQSTSPTTALPPLESIPELEQAKGDVDYVHQGARPKYPKRESCISHMLDSYVYSDEEEYDFCNDCPHGEGFDHASLDSEGCQYSPQSDDLQPQGQESFDFSFEKDPMLPTSDLRARCISANFLDGRKSGASRVSSGSEALDQSELSQTRATPPPKLTFRRRRTKVTPKNPVSPVRATVEQPVEALRDSENPPRKRPRKFLSTTGVVWTTATENAFEEHHLNMSAPILDGEKSPSEKEDMGEDIWSFEGEEFHPKPKKRISQISRRKSVSFASKDKLIDQQYLNVASQDDLVVKLPPRPLSKVNIKFIDGHRICDSIDLNKEKMKSGKWKKFVKLLNKEIQTTGELSSSPSFNKRSSLFSSNSLSRRISAMMASTSPTKSKQVVLNEEDTAPLDKIHPLIVDYSGEAPDEGSSDGEDNRDEKFVSPEPEEPQVQEEPVQLIDVVSKTSRRLTASTEHLFIYTEQPSSTRGNQTKEKTNKRSSLRRKFSIKSPLSRFRKSKHKNELSPLKLESVSSLKQEIIDGNTYIRMSEVEPTYLESLKDMGRLSPSVRRLSQRYCLFQKGNMSRSLELLDCQSTTSSNLDPSDYTASLPVLSLKVGQFSTKVGVKSPIPEISSPVPDNSMEEITLHEEEKQAPPPKAKKDKNRKRYSILSGFGTWPRRVPSPETITMSEPQDEVDNKEQKVARRKRFSLLRFKDAGDANDDKQQVDVNVAPKSKRRSIFGSLRRRFSMKKKSSDMKTIEPAESQLEILTDGQCLPTSSHYHEVAQNEMARRSLNLQRPGALWRVESSPNHGDKWIALKKPKEESPGRLNVKSDGLIVYTARRMSTDEILAEKIITKQMSPLKSSDFSTIDAFFSRTDDGISHEEIIDSDGYVVVEDLNQFANEKQLEATAEAVVHHCMWNALGEESRKKFSSPTHFSNFIWSQSTRAAPVNDMSHMSELSLQNEINKTAEAVALAVIKDVSEANEKEYPSQSHQDKPSYYRAMIEGYENLSTDNTQISEGSLVVNVSNNNSMIGDFNNNNDFGLNVSGKIDDSLELIDLVDAFFGHKPAPVSPEQAQEMRTRMDEFVQFYEQREQQGQKDDSLNEGADSSMRNGEEVFNDWQSWYESFSVNNKSMADQSALKELDYKPAGSMFYGGSSEPPITHEKVELEWKPAGSIFFGNTEEPEPQERPVRNINVGPSPVKNDPKSRFAKNAFVVRSPADVSAAMKKTKSATVIGTSTPKSTQKLAAERRRKRYSEGFWIKVNGTTGTSTFRPVWNSPLEKPVGIHCGTPERVEATQKCSARHEDRPVGVHYGMKLDVEENTIKVPDSPISIPDSLDGDSSFEAYPLTRKPAITQLIGSPMANNSYYSIDSSIDFSSSSIVDRLPV